MVLLRGVNVGGHRRFRPTVLAKELRHLDVVNIGAAGTFVIRRPVARAQLEEEIRTRLPFVAEIAVCSGGEIQELLSLDPFAAETAPSEAVRFVGVMARPSTARMSFPRSLPPRGRWLVKVMGRHGPFVIGIYRRNMRTIGWLKTLDDVFEVPVTVRNWNTVGRIAEALRDPGTPP